MIINEDLIAKISAPISGITLAFGPWLNDIGEKCLAAIIVSLVTFGTHKTIALVWQKQLLQKVLHWLVSKIKKK